MFQVKGLLAVAVSLIECQKNSLSHAKLADAKHCVKFSLLFIGLQLLWLTQSFIVQRMGFTAVLHQENRRQTWFDGNIIELHEQIVTFSIALLLLKQLQLHFLRLNLWFWFVRSFIRCEWLANKKGMEEVGSVPDFTPDSMPPVYPKVKRDCQFIDQFPITTKEQQQPC